MPFLAVLADPGLITSNLTLAAIRETLGIADAFDFQIVLGIASFALLILSAAVRSLGSHAVNRFAQMRNYTLGARLLETYLRRPYAYFLSRHSSDIAKELLQEISILIMQIYQPMAVIVAQSATLVVLIVLLVLVNPMTAFAGVVVLGGCYAAIFAVVQPRLARLGQTRARVDRIRYGSAVDALGGIKILKILGREGHYLERFKYGAHEFGRVQALSTSLAQIPRYAVEAVAFGGIILLALSLMLQHRDTPSTALAHILPLLGFYAFAGYRILPAMQGVYSSLAQIRYGLTALDVVSAALADRDSLPPLPQDEVVPLPFARSVEIAGLSFRYAQAETPSIAGISLTIPAGSTLGIVGPTGAGKTTFVDLFLGLLAPDGGAILVDGVPVTAENLRNWQADLGYVPQDVFLLDASVAENIAFGLKPEEIDLARVREAARMAQILDFVEQDMPQGFQTSVGERGVRLSGGQRQRIGIARALYRDPGLIVFDEATSALDNLTEQEVVRAIGALSALEGSARKTVLLIAHRISTVKDCDQILVLEKGRMVGIGPYEELYCDNAVFRSLVDAREIG
nr:ABC transporter ATP-binding protein [Stagnihabitans tardus]